MTIATNRADLNALQGHVVTAPFAEAGSSRGQVRACWVARLAATALLIIIGGSLTGCVLAPVGPGWCYYHPYRCR